MLSASHTPLKQRFEAPAVHVPLPGIATPVAAFAAQVLVPGFAQYSVAVQCASLVQPTSTPAEAVDAVPVPALFVAVTVKV